MENTSQINTNIPSKGLITDLPETFVSSEVWTHMRNGIVSGANRGEANVLQNEPSTLQCVSFPYQPIGFIRIKDGRWVVFSTDNINSEIGIISERNCEYTKVINAKCLNFNTSSLIDGEFREQSDCTETIYWTDAGRNPRRYLNLSNIPYKYTTKNDECQTKIFTNELDCSALKVDRDISVPAINVSKGSGGLLTNGSYQFAIAYSTSKIRSTDFYSLTLPFKVWSRNNAGTSLSLNIEGLDRNFDEFELVVIYTQNNAVSAKTIGFYPTSSSTVSVSSIDRPEFTTISLDEVIIKRPKYPYADMVESNDQYLMWGGVRTNTELNYQATAMQIKSEYIVYKMAADSYRNNQSQIAGYMRDETYAFAIQWLNKNGEWSSAYHIPGPELTAAEMGLASGADVYETGETHKYEVENNAGQALSTRATLGFSAHGKSGTFISTEHYPDREILFGDARCTPLRFHKMPDDCITPRYDAGGRYINAIGMQFSNIEHPKDSDGNYIQDIVGYRIVRGDREGNESIIAKGVFSNVRNFREVNGDLVKYSNYPYNDLSPDQLLSSTPVFRKKGKENGFKPLAGVSDTEFNFYSAETQFNKVALGEELKIYSQESATVDGFFEKVYQHPQAKLLTEFDLYFALIIGALDGYYSVTGKKCTTVIGNSKGEFVFGGGIPTPGGPTTPTKLIVGENAHKMEQACDDALKFTSHITVDGRSISAAERVLRSLAKVGVFAYFALQTANTVLDIILNASGWQDYALQYNSHGFFNKATCAVRDYRRRKIDYYQYIYDGMNTVDDTIFNNYKREDSVFIRINKPLDSLKVVDNTRKTLSGFGICSNPAQKVSSTASMYYGAIKRKIPNQYGALENITYLDTGTSEAVNPDFTKNKIVYTSPLVFGGDAYITRMTVKRPQHIFSEELHNVPSSYIFDYSQYRNIGNPRYWINTEPYDMSEFVVPRPSRSRTPQAKYNLDCLGNSGFSNITTVKDRHFYLTYNGVLDFFVESKFNLDFRDYKDHQYQNFYSASNTNLTQLFRADRTLEREEFVYDNAYFKQLVENYIAQQLLDYDPTISEKCHTYVRNKVIYSLPTTVEQKGDSWLIYLPLNYIVFPSVEFGNLTSIKGITNQQLMFLFDKSAPYITPGRDEIQLDGSGRKITLGDAGVFARPLIPIAYTDYYFASSQSQKSFVNTQYGSFFVSQNQGRIFSYTGQLDEITRVNTFWFKEYLPSILLEAYPDFPLRDNMVEGVGTSVIFDNTLEILYITKRDYKPKYGTDILKYNSTKGQFEYNGRKVHLHDQSYFEDASWTVSYHPGFRMFVSHHDWHPEFVLQGETHFMSVKDKTLWKHNQRCDSFCQFYNKDFPFEVEVVDSTGQNVTVLRSFEYMLDAGRYYTDCADFHQILDENFDFAVVSNNEQMSGLLKLNLQSKKDLSQLFNYPKYDYSNNWTDILFNKEEQRYRFNQFDDITKDRGEFTNKNLPLWTTEPNGYVRNINELALDPGKAVQHKKKFRGTWTKVKLIKSVSGNKKLKFKLINSKKVQSPR